MNDSDNFDREYFIQTRQEIDTEKRERDHILNIAVIVLGALGFAFVQTDKTQTLIRQPFFIAIEISVLAILTSLFWVRWMKLRQIADRWYTLRNILNQHFEEQKARNYLEYVVMRGFEKARYIKKDITLCFSMSSPIYFLLAYTVYFLPISICLRIIIFALIIALHIFIIIKLLSKKLVDPFADL
jgi:hypothetical protein